MKRFLMITLAVLMGVSLVTTVFAQTTTEKAHQGSYRHRKGEGQGTRK